MSSSRLVGIAMILTGLILWIGPASWLATRKLVVRDPPISLTRGPIQTTEFIINLHSGYRIEMGLRGRHRVPVRLQLPSKPQRDSRDGHLL
jgi:hypothetical protein